jgi:TusA-related sulfurtransferase
MEFLDITREHCPMTFVKTKLRLSKMKPGERVEIYLTEGEPLDNVPKSVAEQGDKIIEVAHLEKNIHKVVVEKC